MKWFLALAAMVGCGGAVAWGALPVPPAGDGWFDFPLVYGADVPGEFSAKGFLPGVAGGEGFVVAREGHFFTSSPAHRIRFLGVNLCYGACFPTHAQADELAQRLARFGINMIRFHHMDSQAYPGGIFADRSLTTLSTEALDRLDYLIAAFKANGVYADLNLHVSRSDARAHGMENAEKAPGMDKQIDLFDPVLIESQKKEYARDLLTHVNGYTHVAYAEEPAVGMVEVNNENTLFIWGAESNLEGLPEPFAGELRGFWNEWLVKKYGTREKLAAAWGEGALGADETLADKSVRSRMKNVAMGAGRAHDWYNFLQQLDQKYFDEMYHYVKDDLHVRALVTGTTGLGALGTMNQARTDFVDGHEYWQHPTFPGNPGGWSTTNYKIENTPMVDSPALGVLPGLASIRVAGKPFTVTEYDHPAPSEWRAEMLPELATMAALQDWDAVFIFAYSHSANFHREHADSFFDLASDVGSLDLMPVAARLFVSGAVKPLPRGEPVFVGREESLANGGKYYFNLQRQLRELHGVTPEVLLRRQLSIWFEPAQEKFDAVEEDRRATWTSAGAGANGGSGRFELADSRAAVFVGFPKEGEVVKLGPVRLEEMRSPFVVATLTTPGMIEELSAAKTLLLTVTGRVQNKGMEWNGERNSVGTHWGSGPGELERVKGVLRVPAGYEVRRLDAAGEEMGDGVEGAMDLGRAETMWFKILRK